MTAPPNLLPFDREKAKAGAKVVTRDGRPVTRLIDLPEGKENSRVIAVINGAAQYFYSDGSYYYGHENPLDLFLLPEVKYVPWTMEDVPLGAWYRTKGDSIARAGFIACSEALSVSGMGRVSYKELLNEWEHATESLAGPWKPCGREVRE